MGRSDISPLKVIFSRVINRLMNELVKISRYLFASAYRNPNIPAPFLSLLLLCSAPDKSKQSSLQGMDSKVRDERVMESLTRET